MLELPCAAWYQEAQGATGSKVRLMQCVFPLCSVSVKKARPADLESTADSGGAAPADNSFAYDLVVAQVGGCKNRWNCLSVLIPIHK